MAGPRLVYTYQLVGERTDSDWLVSDLLEENFGGVLSLFGPQLQQLRQVKQLPSVSKQLSYHTPANTKKSHLLCQVPINTYKLSFCVQIMVLVSTHTVSE